MHQSSQNLWRTSSHFTSPDVRSRPMLLSLPPVDSVRPAQVMPGPFPQDCSLEGAPAMPPDRPQHASAPPNGSRLMAVIRVHVRNLYIHEETIHVASICTQHSHAWVPCTHVRLSLYMSYESGQADGRCLTAVLECIRVHVRRSVAAVDD